MLVELLGCIIGTFIFQPWMEERPAREVTYKELSSPHLVIAGFSNGYVFTVDGGSGSSLLVYGPDGLRNFGADLHSLRASPIAISAVAVDRDGTVAAAWKMTAPGETRGGVDLFTHAGLLVRTIAMGVFLPDSMAFSEDHALWVLGLDPDPPRDYMMVRKYTLEGKVTGAYLPASQFAILNETAGSWQTRKLFVAHDRIGLRLHHSSHDNTFEWVELTLDGDLKRRWTLPAAGVVAFTEDGQLYSSRQEKRNGNVCQQPLRVDWKTSEWKNAGSPVQGLLVGNDGNALVFLEWKPWITPVQYHLLWFDLSETRTSKP